MKISTKILSKYFIIYVAFIVSLLFFSIVNSINLTNEPLEVYSGRLYIDEKLSDKTEYNLIGEWEFYDNNLYTPSDLSSSNIPKSYSHLYTDGLQINGTNVTYVITIDNNYEQRLTLEFPTFRGSYTIYHNGNIVHSTEKDWRGNPLPQTYNSVRIPLDNYSFNKIVVQMSRDNYFLFGFSQAPIIGSDAYFQYNDNLENIESAVTGMALFVVSLFIIVLYIGSYGPKKEKIPVFFLLGAIIVTYLEFMIAPHLVVANFYGIAKFYSFSLIMSVFLIYTYIYLSFKDIKKIKGFYEGSMWLVSVFVIFLIFSDTNFSDLVYRLSLVLYLYLLSTSLHFTTVALNEKNRNAIYVFTILTILVLSFVINIKYLHLYRFNVKIFISYAACFSIIILKLLRENYIYSLNFKNLEYDLMHKSKLKHDELVEYNDVLLAEIDARKEAEQSLVEITTKDYLSGLYNRLYSNSRLAELAEKFENDGIKFSIIMIDIDNFKYINDTYGHDCGDEVIKELANVMMASTRHSDIVTRWGGEEFLVILPNAKIESAIYVAEKIRKSIESCNIPIVGTVTASLGVAEIKENESYETTIIRSDENLYLAKKNGKNCTYPKL